MNKYANWFACSCGVILLTVSTLKFFGLTTPAEFWLLNDPVFKIKNQTLYSIAALLELCAAGCLLLPQSSRYKLWLASYFGANFLAYRLAVLTLADTDRCACLGHIGLMSRFTPAFERFLLWGLAGWMLLGALVFLIVTNRIIEPTCAAVLGSLEDGGVRQSEKSKPSYDRNC